MNIYFFFSRALQSSKKCNFYINEAKIVVENNEFFLIKLINNLKYMNFTFLKLSKKMKIIKLILPEHLKIIKAFKNI